MNALLEQMLARGPVVTDGAWGTQLQQRGLDCGGLPDSWNLTHSNVVLEVAKSYVAAGSEIILTNTFGANRRRLAHTEWIDRLEEINRRGVEISKEACAGRAYVFASIGPTGQLPGEETEADLENVFQEQARVLAEAGADGLAIETMSDLSEAKAAVRAAKSTGLPVVACMVFDTGRGRDRTMTGVTPEQAAKVLTEARADVIGANCGQGVAGFVAICERLKGATDKPIWIKANAGLPEIVDGNLTYRTTPEEFAGFVPDLWSAGASFVGGCCGTAPSFIRAISAALRGG